MKKDKKDWLYSLGIIALLLVSVWGYMYKEGPEYVLNQYIKGINEKDYEQVYKTLYEPKQITLWGDEDVKQYMEEYFSRNQLIKIEKKQEIEKNKDFASYIVSYQFNDKSMTSSLSLTRNNGKWQVIFPFKATNVNIEVPTGGAIIMEGKRIIPTKQDGYVKMKLLPDHYNIRIEYPNDVQDDYFTTLKVPYQKEIKSPYKMYDVEVSAPEGTVVELAGVKQKVEGESIVFKNIVEGQYELSLLDESNILETSSQIIEVKEGNQFFSIEALNISKEGYKQISEFINLFYKDYKRGILEKNNEFFLNYGQEDILKQAQQDYKAWLIDYKEVQDVQMEIRVEQVKMQETGEVSMQILEVIQLSNKEEDGIVDYQVILKWNNKISLLGGEYSFKERNLVESLVSYKDNEGNWVQY